MTTYEVQCRYKGVAYGVGWATVVSTLDEQDSIKFAKREQSTYDDYEFRVLKTESVVTKTVVFEG